MKVLHLYSGDLFGGIQSYLLTLEKFRSFCPDMQPEFALCFPGPLSRELEANQATIHWLGGVQMRYPWLLLRARRRLRKLLRERSYDVAVCHSIWPQALFGPVVREAQLPLVFYHHNINSGQHWFERWARRVLPDHILSNSRFTQENLAALYPCVGSDVVYLPVPIPQRFSSEERKQIRAEFAIPEKTVVIIQVSRMAAFKGQALHLEALGRLTDVPNWTAWIVGGVQSSGEAAYFNSLQQQSIRLGISDRVHFLGWRTDVPRLLAAADIFCQPSFGDPEPFGITFVEALGAGLPVVSTAMGGALEIVDSSCGTLVPPNDPDALARALGRLCAETDFRSALSAEAPQRARFLCDPEQQMKVLEQMLRTAVFRFGQQME